jgi:hypothetical protein
MGVGYAHCLIAQDNTVRPQPDRIRVLIEAWIERGFIARPDGVPAQTGARFATDASYSSSLQNLQHSRSSSPRPDPWMPFSVPPVGDSMAALAGAYTLIRWDANPNATYPLQTVPQESTSFSPKLMIELSEDFINTHTDPYGGDARQVEPTCSCGHNLEYESTAGGWLDTQRIRRVCPVCGQAFRPQDQLAEIRDGADGTIYEQPGGLCNRFAIIIDFYRYLPIYRLDSQGVLVAAAPKVTDIFLQTCTIALGIQLNEFSYYT